MNKFFNYGQEQAPKFQPVEYVHVADKMDGSLGIIYPTPLGEWAVATRGSFTSDQAIHATTLLNSGIDPILDYLRTTYRIGFVPVVEIIYPENRIVLNYGNLDSLPLLGFVDLSTGVFDPAIDGKDRDGEWPWGVAESKGEMTYAEALALPPRENAEGLVLYRSWDGAMVKVKQEDYVITSYSIHYTKLYDARSCGFEAHLAHIFDTIQLDFTTSQEGGCHHQRQRNTRPHAGGAGHLCLPRECQEEGG